MIQTLTIIDVKLTMENLETDTQYGTVPNMLNNTEYAANYAFRVLDEPLYSNQKLPCE